MLFFAWMLLIFLVSVLWAYYSLKKERQRHEIENAKEEMTTGRVIYHASSNSSGHENL